MANATAAYVKKVEVSADEVDWKLLPATTASLNQSGTMLDDTILGSSGHRSRILGILDWGVTATANWRPADDALSIIRNAWLNRTVMYVRYLPDGTLANGYAGPVVVENFSHGGGVDEIETVEISLQSNGTLVSADD